jgi:hypothetical protein
MTTLARGLHAGPARLEEAGLHEERLEHRHVIAEITYLFEYPRTGIILRCDVSWLPTGNHCLGWGPLSAIS